MTHLRWLPPEASRHNLPEEFYTQYMVAVDQESKKPEKGFLFTKYWGRYVVSGFDLSDDINPEARLCAIEECASTTIEGCIIRLQDVLSLNGLELKEKNISDYKALFQ